MHKSTACCFDSLQAYATIDIFFIETGTWVLRVQLLTTPFLFTHLFPVNQAILCKIKMFKPYKNVYNTKQYPSVQNNDKTRNPENTRH